VDGHLQPWTLLGPRRVTSPGDGTRRESNRASDTALPGRLSWAAWLATFRVAMRIRMSAVSLAIALLPAPARAASPSQPAQSAQPVAVQVPEASPGPIEPDEHGVVAQVPPGPSTHRLWVGDRLFRHSILFDGDSGRALGMVDTTFNLGGVAPYPNPVRGEIYVVEAVYDRGHRGRRTDYVTIYDNELLVPIGEIELPTKSAEVGHGIALAAVLDGGRFLAIFNQTPATSVTVVDLAARRFAGEIQTAGCGLIYPVGERRFGMLCGDGSALTVELSEDGASAVSRRGDRFFDVVEDPLTEKGVRDGEAWLFSSFEGNLYRIDFSKDVPVADAPWPLTTASERAAGYRIGGNQHLALHRGSRRLYSLVHQGGPGSHKDAAENIWVYDADRHERIQTIHVDSLLPEFLRPYIGIESGSWKDVLLDLVMPNPGVHSIVVTQDDEPLLFARNNEVGAIAILDAMTGTQLRAIEEAGISGGVMRLP